MFAPLNRTKKNSPKCFYIGCIIFCLILVLLLNHCSLCACESIHFSKKNLKLIKTSSFALRIYTNTSHSIKQQQRIYIYVNVHIHLSKPHTKIKIMCMDKKKKEKRSGYLKIEQNGNQDTTSNTNNNNSGYDEAANVQTK